MSNKSLFVINSFVVIVMLSLAALAWNQIPDTQMIPVHYGVDGLPDRYGSKIEGLLVAPLIGAAVTAMFLVIPHIDPRADNLKRSQKAYFMTGLASIALLFSIHTATILNVLGWPVNVVTVLSMGLSVLLAVIGNYMSKVRSNFSFGIRTPWTLSSEKSWSQTHRLGGRLFFLLGASGALLALAHAHQLFLLVILVGSISSAIFLVIYSYMVWKDDPQRHRIER